MTASGREGPHRGGDTIAGYSLIEVMVAATVLSLVMAAAYSNLADQMRTHATQRMLTETMHDARTALQVMADQIEMAGFGVPTATTPSAAARLVTATPAELSFWTKVTAAHSYLTTAAAAGTTSLDVVSATGISNGAAIYVSDADRWYFGAVQSVNGATVRVTPALTYAFGAGSLVTPVERVTFTRVGDELRRNSRRFIDNVTGLSFAYDSATLSAIRQITVTLTVETRGIDPRTHRVIAETLVARVVPRNLAF
jgi:prepilin-type N-terminal cleavage/methylation domain-containing protein